MNADQIINELERNTEVFERLLTAIPEEQYRWRTAPEKWNLLEIVCHLHDEEIEDFRTRVRLVLEDPNQPLPTFNPVAWVTERQYAEKDYDEALQKLITERKASITWLKSLENLSWENIYQHPKMGPVSAKFFLANWLGHDLLHIRQITKLKFDYLAQASGESLDYAGRW